MLCLLWRAQNPTKRPVNESIRAAIAEHPGVKLETVLYRHALHRFERQVRAVPQLAGKLAFLRSAGSVSGVRSISALAHCPLSSAQRHADLRLSWRTEDFDSRPPPCV